jgi:hypothetical protein
MKYFGPTAWKKKLHTAKSIISPQCTFEQYLNLEIPFNLGPSIPMRGREKIGRQYVLLLIVTIAQSLGTKQIEVSLPLTIASTQTKRKTHN